MCMPARAGDAPVGEPVPLLLACRFFDRKCAGYLETEDLEEVLYMTSADVSRECRVVFLGGGIGIFGSDVGVDAQSVATM